MSPQDVLSKSVLACKSLFSQCWGGFNSLTHTRQAEHLPNHLAWTLGHCALSMHRIAHHFDGGGMPDTDFAPGPCVVATDDPSYCYHIDSIATTSEPEDDAAIYPSFERCVQIYDDACDRLAAAVAAASDDQLQREVTWDSATIPLYLLVSRTIFHNGMHAGQLNDLRRALRMQAVLACS